MSVKNLNAKKALNKLRQQLVKCSFFGCVHPISSHAYYATSEEKKQYFLSFFESLIAIFHKNRTRRT